MSTFRTSREFATTPVAVFAAIREGHRLARWWGPNGFTNRFDVCEFRPGGKWVFTMIGPDGQSHPNTSVFTAIDVDRRVVIRHDCAPFFTLTISLEPSSEGTLLQWVQAFDDPTVAEAVRHIVEPANEQNLDRLAAELGLKPGEPR